MASQSSWCHSARPLAWPQNEVHMWRATLGLDTIASKPAPHGFTSQRTNRTSSPRSEPSDVKVRTWAREGFGSIKEPSGNTIRQAIRQFYGVHLPQRLAEPPGSCKLLYCLIVVH